MRWPEPWKRVPLLLTTQTKKPKRISRNLSATNALGAQHRWRQGSVGVFFRLALVSPVNCCEIRERM